LRFELLSSYLTLSEDASPVRPCGTKGFSDNYTQTWDPYVPRTTRDYVVTFHPNLTDAFPFCSLIIVLLLFHKVFVLWIVKVVVRQPSQPIFWTNRYLTTL